MAFGYSFEIAVISRDNVAEVVSTDRGNGFRPVPSLRRNVCTGLLSNSGVRVNPVIPRLVAPVVLEYGIASLPLPFFRRIFSWAPRIGTHE